MKKITLLFFLMIFSFGYSQTIPVTFESNVKVFNVDTAADGNWKADSGLTSVSIVYDPAVGGTHGKVGKITSSTTGFKWQNAQLLMTSNRIDLSGVTKNVTLDVYTTGNQDFLIKLEQPRVGSGTVEKSFSVVGAGWHTVTVDFTTGTTGTANDQYKLLVVFPCYSAGFAAAPFDGDSYIDNVSALVGDAIVAPSAPTVAAPTPPNRNTSDVKSIFSDAYTTYSAGNWCKCWGQSTDVTDELIATNNTRKLSNFNYQGITDLGTFDVSNMTKMHVDLWSSTATSVAIKLINSGPVESGPTLTIVSGWNSFDITLDATNFPGINFSTVFQMSMSANPTGSTVYLDNFYFWKPYVANAPTIGALTVPAKLVGAANFNLTAPSTNSTGAFTYTSSNTNVATISGTAITVIGAGTSVITATQAADATYTSGFVTANLVVTFPIPTVAAPIAPARNANDKVLIYDGSNAGSGTWHPSWGQGTINSTETLGGNIAQKLTNLGYEGITCPSVSLSSMEKLHIDIWSDDETSIKIYLLAGSEPSVTKTLTKGQWNSFDILLSDFTGATLATVTGLKLESGTYTYPNGVSTIYVDNIYAYKGTALAVSKFETSSINIYPNPVVNELNIQANTAIEKVAIFNILGQEVIAKSPKTNTTSIETSQLQKGVYIVKTTIDGSVSTSKIIKE